MLLTHLFPLLLESFLFRPHVVHVHFAVPSGKVAWTSRRESARTPYVLTVHLGDVPGGVPEQTDHLYRIVKPFHHRTYLAIGRCRNSRCPTCREARRAGLWNQATRHSERQRRHHVSAVEKSRGMGEPLRLIWCGRIQQQKNWQCHCLSLLDSGASLEARYSRAMELRGSSAEECCRSANLAGQIFFHGWVT